MTSEITQQLYGKYSKYGYYLDLFFIEKPINFISDEYLFLSIERALNNAGLMFNETVNIDIFLQKTKSVPVNRYVRVPKRFLSNYDQRVYAKNTLDIITYDPAKNKEEHPAYKIDENVFFEQPIFHSPNYLSALLIPLGNDRTILKVSYNWKLKEMFPKIVDITGISGITLTTLLGCGGFYTRAQSFSRSEELCIYYYAGLEKNRLEGNETCVAHLNARSKVEETYNVNCDLIMDFMDEQMGILYSTTDLNNVVEYRNKVFKQYGLDNPRIYSALDKFLNKWFYKTEKKTSDMLHLVTQMINKEAKLDHVYEAVLEIMKPTIKDKPKNEQEILIEDAKQKEFQAIVNNITNILIDYIKTSSLIYKETFIRDYYFTVKDIPVKNTI